MNIEQALELGEAQRLVTLLFLATLLKVPLFEEELEVAHRLQKVVTATFFLALVIYYGDDGRFFAEELLLHRT